MNAFGNQPFPSCRKRRIIVLTMPKSSLISVSDQLHGAWTLYKTHIKRLTLISLFFTVPFFLSIISELIAPTASLATSNAFSGQVAIRFVLDLVNSLLIGPLITVFGVGLMIYLTIGLVRENAPKKLRITVKEYVQLILTAILKFLIIAIPVIFSFIPGVILLVVNADTAKIPFLSIIGIAYIVLMVFAAILYMLWVTTMIQLTEFVVLMNKQPVVKSMHYLRNKVKGQFWAVFGRIFIPKLLIGIPAALLIVVVQGLVSFALLEGITAGNAMAIQVNTYTGILLGVILVLFTSPMVYLADALLFDSLEKQS